MEIYKVTKYSTTSNLIYNKGLKNSCFLIGNYRARETVMMKSPKSPCISIWHSDQFAHCVIHCSKIIFCSSSTPHEIKNWVNVGVPEISQIIVYILICISRRVLENKLLNRFKKNLLFWSKKETQCFKFQAILSIIYLQLNCVTCDRKNDLLICAPIELSLKGYVHFSLLVLDVWDHFPNYPSWWKMLRELRRSKIKNKIVYNVFIKC